MKEPFTQDLIEIESTTANQSASESDNNSEDVLTRHLLKLSEVEEQFEGFTNKFEEINFKLDKLSNKYPSYSLIIR